MTDPKSNNRTQILESIRQLKAQHRDLRRELTDAVKHAQWAKVAKLANLLKANVTARKWRREKLDQGE